MDISIQYTRGQYRILHNGKVLRYAADYGEIAGTKGADEEPLDVYRGLFANAESAFVINQYHENGAFDEHKIMLNFYDEAQAKFAYELTTETPVREIFACTYSQLKWWLQYGNHKKPLTHQSFPFDSENPNMTYETNWANENQTAAQLIYAWRKADSYGELTEPATLDSIMADELADGAEIQLAVFDALVVENKRLARIAQALGRVFNSVSSSLKVVENGIQISAPMKKNGTTNIAVMYEMTDGQVVSVMFHNPDTTPAKISPDDMLVSWKWLLNRKDITIVVAKENGKDLPLTTVARRVMALVEKNTGRFAKANAAKAAETEELARLEAEKAAKLARLEELNAMAEKRENDDETENSSANRFNDVDDLRDYLENAGFDYKGGLTWSKYNKSTKQNIRINISHKEIEVSLWQGKSQMALPNGGLETFLPLENKVALVDLLNMLQDGNSGSLKAENPTIEVTGKEFGDFDTDTEDGLKALRASAKKFMMSLRGKWVHNDYLKRDIEIRKRGIRETFNYSANPIKLKLLAQIEQILATAKPVDGVQVEQPNYKKDVKPNAIRYFHLGSQAVVDGVSVKFDVIIEEDTQGMLHYDLVLEGSRKKAVMDNANPSSITNTGTLVYPQQPETYSTELNDETQDDGVIEQDGLFDAVFDDVHSSSSMILNLFVFEENGNPLPDEDEHDVQAANKPDNLDNIQYNQDLFKFTINETSANKIGKKTDAPTWILQSNYLKDVYAVFWEDLHDERGYVFEINGVSGDFQANTLQRAVNFAEIKIIDVISETAPIKNETNLNPKIPSLAALGIGKHLRKRLYAIPENKGWSNGDILDLSGVSPDIQGALQQHDNNVQALRPEQIERVAGEPVAKLEIGQTFTYPINSKHQFVELINKENQEVHYIAKQYFDYFISKDVGVTFFEAKNTTGRVAIIVMNHSGVEKKGVIMPIKSDLFQGVFEMAKAKYQKENNVSEIKNSSSLNDENQEIDITAIQTDLSDAP